MSHIFVAMSGGVDSSVAAVLLGGERISGVYLRMLDGKERDEADAAQAAQRLGIPFHVLDVSRIFRETVVEDFIGEYTRGRTPNPCAVCNRRVKFGALLEWVLEMGGDALATGHYAQVEQSGDRWVLKRARDARKDQSYFLWGLTQEQLAHIRFPLGGLEKTEVRAIARAHGLNNADRRDSQDICFVPRGEYAGFIEGITGDGSLPGPFVDETGRVLGQHKGIIRYTRGQHKGLGLSTPEPLYVLDKDVDTNTIRLGLDSALWSTTLTAEQFQWIAIPEPDGNIAVTVKTRYSQREAAAIAEPLPGNRVRVVFKEPQRAITPGQSAVLYDGDVVVGGGVICGE